MTHFFVTGVRTKHRGQLGVLKQGRSSWEGAKSGGGGGRGDENIPLSYVGISMKWVPRCHLSYDIKNTYGW